MKFVISIFVLLYVLQLSKFSVNDINFVIYSIPMAMGYVWIFNIYVSLIELIINGVDRNGENN